MSSNHSWAALPQIDIGAQLPRDRIYWVEVALHVVTAVGLLHERRHTGVYMTFEAKCGELSCVTSTPQYGCAHDMGRVFLLGDTDVVSCIYQYASLTHGL